MRRTRTALITTAALVALAACSGSDEGDEENSAAGEETAQTVEDDAASDEAELEDAVTAYTDAYFAPDAELAYEMLSARCQDSIQPAAFASIVEGGAEDYGQLSVESFAVDELAGDMARVTYTVGLPVLDEDLAGQPWVREDEEWKYDAC